MPTDVREVIFDAWAMYYGGEPSTWFMEKANAAFSAGLVAMDLFVAICQERERLETVGTEEREQAIVEHMRTIFKEKRCKHGAV